MRDRFADLLLQRAALLARLDRNRAVDPLAGLKVDDDDVAALLDELPGLEPGRAAAADEALDAALADQIDEARHGLHAELGEASPFASLVARAGLGARDAEVLALLCAVESDPRRQRLVGYLNDDVGARRLTLWTLRQVLGDPDPAPLVGPGGALQRAALLQAPGDLPWAGAPVAVAPAVLWWLVGDRSPEPGLPPGAETVPASGTGLARLAVAAGADRRRRLSAVADSIDATSLLVVPEPSTPAAWDAVIRQATLAGSAVVLELEGVFGPEARERVERASHLAWALTSPRGFPLGALPRRPWSHVPVPAPAVSPAEWEALLPGTSAGPYRLSLDQLHHVAQAAEALGGDLPAAVRRLAAGHVDAAASRVRPTRTWEDLVLDEDRMEQVREVSRRSRQRAKVFEEWGFSPQPSTGVVALFAGPSGTGKTLAAEVIAADLGVDLYKIDLANLVSKYIGETEQNLARVFDAAEASSVALFFDEADALLGRRSEVSDAHDRYANIEVAYLLQRLERYEGVAILATNLAKNIDPAFLRRLHVIVEFPMPEQAERRRIWGRCLPPGAPVADDLDLDRLAEGFVFSGGTIRNTVLSAAFLAAEASSPITMQLAITALRREMQKIGRLVDGTDFG